MGAGGRRLQPAVKDGRGGRLLRQRRLRQREEKEATGVRRGMRQRGPARKQGRKVRVATTGEGGDCGVNVRSAQRWLRMRAREAAAEAALADGKSMGERRGLCAGGVATEEGVAAAVVEEERAATMCDCYDRRPEQQGRVGGLWQRVEATVTGEATMRAGNRGGGGLRGEDGEGQRRPMGGGCGASTFGAAAATGEIGIWWSTTAAGRRGIEVATEEEATEGEGSGDVRLLRYERRRGDGGR
ncbi:hypothetical protein BHE74_00022405 [Ensete ventricosum]|nr:hypothetical protein BHE74_00022405 [Ensete ventricosum]RZR80724.1 hypothetical protein BHM03_00006798 [Ensete ventricosum]